MIGGIIVDKEYFVVDSEEKLSELINKVKEAKKKFKSFIQEKVDNIFKAVSID